MDVDTTCQRLQANNILNNVYAKSIILEGELSSGELFFWRTANQDENITSDEPDRSQTKKKG